MKKLGKITISLSSSVIARCRCKRCGEFPNLYYCYTTWWEIDVREMVNRYSPYLKNKKINPDSYLKDSPSSYYNLTDLKFSTHFKGFRPKLFKNISKAGNLKEFIICSNCGERNSIWQILEYELSILNCNRRSKIKYPNNIPF